MTFVRTTGILLVLAALAACNGSSLPKGEIPADFYLFYRMERPFPDSPAPGSTPAKAPAAKPSGARPASMPKPVMIQIEVEADGTVEYEVHHRSPRPAQWKEKKTLTPEALRKVYDAVVEADLFDAEDKYLGEDESLGSETFYVIGEDRRSKEVLVRGTAVPSLATLRNQIFTLTDIRLTPPREATTGFVMDSRTGKIHRAGCGQVASIPEADRKRSGRVEVFLNVHGAFPCEECRPLERR